MEETDIKAPLLYVMGIDIRPEDAHYVFTHTPCTRAVVVSSKEFQVAQQYVQEVLKAEDESACIEMALHVARATDHPVLVIGEGKGIKAVYSSGDEEEICLSNLTRMN